ncbi:hypothetical protein R3I94_023262 [Phoxinus phoxinus]
MCNTTQWPHTRVWTLPCSVAPPGSRSSASSGFDESIFEATGPGTDEQSDVKPVIQWLKWVEPGVYGNSRTD